MEPENQPMEKEIPFWKPIIFRFHVKFRGCIRILSLFEGFFFEPARFLVVFKGISVIDRNRYSNDLKNAVDFEFDQIF